MKKLRLPVRRNKRLFSIFIIAFAVIGAVMIYVTQAAPAITIDTTLPVPQDVRATGDDKNIILSWGRDFDQSVDKRVVGYYITYRPKGSSEAYKVMQQQVSRDFKNNVDFRTAVQLQPLQNGVEYEINIQSAAGTFQTVNNGPLAYGGDGWTSDFAVANGKVSNKVTVYAKTSSARVDDMRQRLTGFFDDFDQPAGPFDELKWNTATTACIVPGTAAAFLNSQFHSHNQIRSSCDRAGIVSRPRAVFDISNATESNPAVIQFDVDGATQPRDTWYLDIIPLSARSNNLPLDVTSHNDLFDADSEDPGNMIRINSRADTTSYAYYGLNRSPQGLQDTTEETCEAWCEPIIVPGLSPLPYPEDTPKVPNVRSQWIVQFTPTKMRVYINGAFVASKVLPAEFAAQKKYALHSTIFSYNTGKQYNQVIPYVQMLHWDNFGFSGPAPTTESYSYIEGGPTGTTPVFSTSTGGTFEIGDQPRTTIIKVPDPIGNVVNGQAQLYMTLQNTTSGTWTWSSNDHVLVNGKRYNVPNPATLVRTPLTLSGCTQYSAPYVPFALAIPINKADLVQGNNTITFNINGSTNGCNGRPPTVFNVHLEIPYAKSDSTKPAYTPPKTVFGQSYLNVTKPPITSCDQYWFVERDLGLPYEAGKTNLDISQGCVLLTGHHTTSTTTPPPPSDTTKPTVSLTSPAANANFTSGNISFSANATDNVSVTSVEFYVDGTQVGTGTAGSGSNSYALSLTASSFVNGSHTVHAIARDAAGNSQQSSSVTISVNISAATARFATLPVNATLPSESTCADNVRTAAETRSSNAAFNARKGTNPHNTIPRVTGNYTGTTDQIIQWAACKWGMDEDILRAQAAIESYWFQNAGGDLTTDPNSCTPVYPIGTYNGQSGVCPESIGLLQVRWNYHRDAFEDQNAVFSTAYNIDYYGSVWRACYNGEYTWLNTVERGATYAAGDVDGCLGMWFSGRWRTAPALEYIARVRDYLNQRIWETTSFKNASAPGQQPIGGTSDTTAPSVSLTAPTAGQSISGTFTISANATDTQSAIASVSYYLDGSSTAFSTDVSAPFTSSWNTATVSNGNHSIVVRATDTAGNTGSSSSVSFTVANVVPDTTVPVTSISDPANGVTVSGTKIVTATASDNVGVARVELLIDGVVKATDSTSPYSFSWDTLGYSNGSHTLQTKAYDAANNSAVSALRTVTVQNTITSPKLGDLNNDGIVNIFDLSILLSNWNKTGATAAQGDLNSDGTVNLFDLSLMLANWGSTL